MLTRRRSIIVSGIILWSLLVGTAAAGPVQPVQLRCEYADNPLGIDVRQPRLSWVLRSAERGQRQTAYQILTASAPALLKEGSADLWDSGRVDSAESLHIVYAGKPLRSGQRACWTVRVWNREGQPSPFSSPAWWETGLLETNDWHGRWIRHPAPAPAKPEDFFADDPAPLMRRAFTIDKPLRRARVYVSGLGYGELYLNGRRVGDRLLEPAWTTYSQRVFYATHDVTDLLHAGDNAVGIMIGNGWYNPLPMRMWGRYNLRDALTVGRPRAILQMNIEYTDGSRDQIVTDEQWRTADGPIVRNSVYLGEVYDARREQSGWCDAGFDDTQWVAAEPADEPLGTLRAQDLPPIRVTRVIQPMAIHELPQGLLLYDLGQNFAGWVRLRVRGEAGTRVSMRYGELECTGK